VAPISDTKPKQFTLTLSESDLKMLKDLADDTNDSSAEAVRALVRTAYAKRFKFKIPGATTMPTLRAIIDQISGPVHYTGGNIATSTGLPLGYLTSILETLEGKGILECIDHKAFLPTQKERRHPSENWTWELRHPRDRAFATLAKLGYDPDADLTPKT
jgi:hypothetical protein